MGERKGLSPREVEERFTKPQIELFFHWRERDRARQARIDTIIHAATALT